MKKETLKYRLGLDVGSTSLGWWIWEEDDQGEVIRSVDGGVKIYSDGRDPKKGSSLAVDRRVARGMRRRRDRYLKRRTRLMNQLIDLNLMPERVADQKRLEKLNPYRLRAEALNRPLKPYHLGRALFHLNQRRGFKSNRIVESASDEKESGVIRTGVKNLDQTLEANSCRTLGEFLHKKHQRKKLLRFRPGTEIYPDRKHYEHEFDQIQKAQLEHQTLSVEDWSMLKSTIFHQRPLRPVLPGKCSIFPDEERARLALPISQHFRILQEVNNLKVIQSGERDRPLNVQERRTAVELLLEQKEVKFESLRKKLGLRLDSMFNLESEKRKKLTGDETAAKLSRKELFGKRWRDFDFDRQSQIVQELLDNESEEELCDKAQLEWELNIDQATKLAHTSLPQGYGFLSEKALNEIVPWLERGYLYHEAFYRAFPDSSHSMLDPHRKVDRLPYYPELLERHISQGTNEEEDDVFTRLGRIANPTVHVGLNQIRRVVNAIIDYYGPPKKIMVELARDLKNSLEKRREIESKQTEEQNKNEQRRQDIRNCGLEPSGEYLRKTRLWEEQGSPQARCCPYCGTQISYMMVLDNRTQIDHILPFSKTLDDSMSNKVVCLTSCNQEKRNRSPWEAFGHNQGGSHDYETMLQRVYSCLPSNKKWRFDENAMEIYKSEEAGFLDRQLNDTRYLSRIAKTYLQNLCESPSDVSVTPGTLTGLLRGKWGLNKILADSNFKKRTDHRHHAVDAAVIALIDRTMLQRVSEAAATCEKDGVDRLLANMPTPRRCENFRDQIKKHVREDLVVVHRPRHTINEKNPNTTSGKLHNETAYGIVNAPDKNGNCEVVIRSNLAAMTQADGVKLLSGTSKRTKLVDNGLREKLLQCWEHFDLDGKKWGEFCEHVNKPGNFSKFGVRRVRCTKVITAPVLVEDAAGKSYKALKPDSNAFMEIYQTKNGSFRAEIVTTFAANQENFKPSWCTEIQGAKFAVRLHINDLFAIGTGNSRELLRVVKLSGSRIWGAHVYEGGALQSRHNDAEDPFKYIYMSASKFITEGLRKVNVNELGHIHDPGPIADRL